MLSKAIRRLAVSKIIGTSEKIFQLKTQDMFLSNDTHEYHKEHGIVPNRTAIKHFATGHHND
jgi:hypothetical protein